MGKIIKAEKRGGGIESKVIEEYTPLTFNVFNYNTSCKLCTLYAKYYMQNMQITIHLANYAPYMQNIICKICKLQYILQIMHLICKILYAKYANYNTSCKLCTGPRSSGPNLLTLYMVVLRSLWVEDIIINGMKYESNNFSCTMLKNL